MRKLVREPTPVVVPCKVLWFFQHRHISLVIRYPRGQIPYRQNGPLLGGEATGVPPYSELAGESGAVFDPTTDVLFLLFWGVEYFALWVDYVLLFGG